MIETLIDQPGQSVLVVDLTEASGGESTAETLRRDLDGFALHRVDALRAAAGIQHPVVETLAKTCGVELRRQGIRPSLIVGYCSAASLSLHIAADLVAHGGPHPPMLLIDPTWARPRYLAYEAARVHHSLGGERLAPEPLTLPNVIRTLRTALEHQLRGQQLEPDEVEACALMMIQQYQVWFGFLFSTSDSPIPVPGGPVRLLISEGSGASAGPGWPVASVSVGKLPEDGSMGRALVDALHDLAAFPGDGGAARPPIAFRPARSADHAALSNSSSRLDTNGTAASPAISEK